MINSTFFGNIMLFNYHHHQLTYINTENMTHQFLFVHTNNIFFVFHLRIQTHPEDPSHSSIRTVSANESLNSFLSSSLQFILYVLQNLTCEKIFQHLGMGNLLILIHLADGNILIQDIQIHTLDHPTVYIYIYIYNN